MNFITWLWGRYTVEHVNKLYRMARRHVTFDNFICLTHESGKFDEGVRIVRPPREFESLGGCYRRLWTWTSKALDHIGHRVWLHDVDSVIFKNIDYMVDDSPFKIWKCPSLGAHKYSYGPGLSLFTPGYLDDLYDKFKANPAQCITEARLNKWTGTDQSLIDNHIHPHTSVWSESDGVLSFRDHIKDVKPDNIAYLGFYGSRFDPMTCQIKWVREAYK